MNVAATDYYLTHIRADFGDDIAKSTITSVRQHIDYYQTISNSSSPSLRALTDRHSARARLQDEARYRNAKFDQEVRQALEDTSSARQQRLRSASGTPERIEVRIFVYKRNLDVVAEVLVEQGDTQKFMPLTKSQHRAVAKTEPKEKGKVIGSLL